eukprot:scaffold51159_cov69-Phaeocystis_antarctica.AAC.2
MPWLALGARDPADFNPLPNLARGLKPMRREHRAIYLFLCRRGVLSHNRVLVGKLDPTHNIRMMGVPCCSFCPGIGDYHTGECAENKAKQKRFLAREQKLNDGKPNMPNPKPVQRGKPAGMRE